MMWTGNRSRERQDDCAGRGAIEHLAARRAARHASAVISVIQDALLAVDETGRIADVNRRFCAMTGFTRAELIGRRRFPFFGNGDAKSNARAIQGVLDEEDVATALRIALVRKTGECIPVQMAVAPLRNATGDLLGYVATLRHLVGSSTAGNDEDDRAVEVRREHALRAVAEIVASSDSASAMLVRIAREAALLIGADSLQISRMEGSRLRLRGSCSLQSAAVKCLATFPVSESVPHLQVVEPEFADPALGGGGSAGTGRISLPIRAGSEIWGAMIAATSDSHRTLRQDAEAELGAFIAAAGLAIIGVDARMDIEAHVADAQVAGSARGRAPAERLQA
jgi:PAS domain S-box-containing protein